MTDPREFAANFQAELPDLLAFTERVVNIDSGSYDAAGVNAVIGAFAGFLQDIGFSVSRTPIPARGDQLTARMIRCGRLVPLPAGRSAATVIR
jgi:glutamate carboxypeptidase